MDISAMPSTITASMAFDLLRNLKLSAELSMGDARKEAQKQMGNTLPAIARDFLLMNLYKSKDGRYNFNYRLNEIFIQKKYSFKFMMNTDVLEKHYKSNIMQFPKHLLNKTYEGPVLFIKGSESPQLE